MTIVGELGDLLLLKVIIAVSVVLFLSYIAEHISPRWAGILSGLPTGSAITLYFIGYENGESFLEQAALFNAIGLVAMQFCIYGYYAGKREETKGGVFAASASAVVMYLMAALVLRAFDRAPYILLFASAASIVIFKLVFIRIPERKLASAVRLSIGLLFMRALISSAIIISVIWVAFFIGPKWSGLLTAFPTTLFPLLIIIHTSYGTAYSNNIIKHVPDGLGGLYIFSLALHFLVSSTGFYAGFSLALVLTVIYLIVYIGILSPWLEQHYVSLVKLVKPSSGRAKGAHR